MTTKIAPPKFLSKSSFMAGMDCPRKLWQLLWDRASASPPDGMAMLIMEYGVQFGRLAQSLFPQGTLIDINPYKLEDAIEDTQRAIESGVGVIFEAAFCHEQCRILADIIEKLPDGSWHIIEVKSSTKQKPEHVVDLAYQKWVIERCGFSVSRCSVIHANKNGVWPDIDSIFSSVEVTDLVDDTMPDIEANINNMLALTTPGCEAPESRQHFSKKCHDCDFKKTVCWEEIDNFTIYDVIHATRIPKLEAENILFVKDIPDGFTLSDRDRKTVDRINNKRIDVDTKAISRMLDSLAYPIHFLDFESVSVAVPLFNETHPWEKLAFQYSLHIMDADGSIRHLEFLHKDASNPSFFIAEQLVRDIGDEGSIVVYHAGMEKGVLEYLRNRFVDHAAPLQSMIDRLWDLEVVFKKHYRHWKFGTKSSIKVVLPTLIPELSYKDLDIQQGGTASWKWIQMIKSDDKITKTATANALKEYCKLDTVAMVELLKSLVVAQAGQRMHTK